MARIAGVDIPNNKRLEIALTYIFGVGRTTAVKICDELKLDRGMKARDLTEEQVAALAALFQGAPPRFMPPVTVDLPMRR